MINSSLYIINSRGEKEKFSFKKVYRSARRSGASKEVAYKIAEIIEREVIPGTKTLEIFRKVKRLLSREAPGMAMRFNLKEAMRKLGPTGFPFEKYVSRIFSKAGFSVKLNQSIAGFCCTYEIDFLAQKDDSLIIGECKYHNTQGQRVDLPVALSNYARFLDIEKKFSLGKQNKDLKLKSLLVTNTKFTTKAIKYSQCVGVKLLGWRYPKKKGLEYLIDTDNLYPITILPSFKKDLAGIFAKQQMMLAGDVLDIKPEIFAKRNQLSLRQVVALVKEARALLREDV